MVLVYCKVCGAVLRTSLQLSSVVRVLCVCVWKWCGAMNEVCGWVQFDRSVIESRVVQTTACGRNGPIYWKLNVPGAFTLAPKLNEA